MAFGLGVLRLPPAAFWALSLREVAAAAAGAVGRPARGPAPERSVLAALMAAFPDEMQEETGDGWIEDGGGP